MNSSATFKKLPYLDVKQNENTSQQHEDDSDDSPLDLGIIKPKERPQSRVSEAGSEGRLDAQSPIDPSTPQDRVGTSSSRRRTSSRRSRSRSNQRPTSSEDDPGGSKTPIKSISATPDHGSAFDDLKIQSIIREQQIERERLARNKREDELLTNNRDLSEKLRRHEVEVELMKGQLKRRNELLDHQREAFFKELILLREELFKKGASIAYQPTDYSLFNWSKKNRYEDEMANETYQSDDILDSENNTTTIDTASYFALKEQSKKVQETLANLKNLELKRKSELDRLQKEREDAEKLKKKLIRKADKLKKQSTLKTLPIVESPSPTMLEELEEDTDTQPIEEKLEDQVILIPEEVPKQEKKEEKPELVIERASPVKPPPDVLILSDSDEEDLSTDKELVVMEEIPPRPPSRKQTPQPISKSNSKIELLPPPIEKKPSQQQFVPIPIQEIKLPPPKQRNEEAALRKSQMIPLILSSQEQKKEKDQQQLKEVSLEANDLANQLSDYKTQMDILKRRLQFYKDDKREENVPKEGPRGEVALVFTDVQDSTRLWELDPLTMEKSLKLHNSIIRSILAETDGFEVKTEGDAFMCAFHRVEDAVEFAIKTQTSLVYGDWPNELMSLKPGRIEYDTEDMNSMIFRGLRVRMGIHVGKPIVEKDPVTGRYDYFGPVVNRSARVEGQAAGGQIVISNSVWDSIKDKLDTFSEKIWCKYMGPVVLKGMDDPEIIRTILPYHFRNRKFPEPTMVVDPTTGITQIQEKERETSSALFQSQLRDMSQKRSQIKKNKDKIKAQIEFKLKMDALENTLKEKDQIIEFLKLSLENSPLDEADEEEIKRVFKRYEELKSEHVDLMACFNDVYKSFQEDDSGFDDEEEVFGDNEELLRTSQEGDNLFDRERNKYENQLEYMEKLIKSKDKRIRDLRANFNAAKRIFDGNRRHKSPLKKRYEDLKYLSKNRVEKSKKRKDKFEAEELEGHEAIKSIVNKKSSSPPKKVEVEVPKVKPDVTANKMKSLIKAKLASPANISETMSSARSYNSRIEPSIKPIVSSASIPNRKYLPYDSFRHDGYRSLENVNSSPVPSSIAEITSILRDAIQEAIGMSNESKNLNWETFLDDASQNVVEDVPSVPYKENSKDPKKTIIILDEKTGQYVQISKESLKKWGVINAAKFIAEQQYNSTIGKNVKVNQREVVLDKSRTNKEKQPKKSYSRLLESFTKQTHVPVHGTLVNVNIIHQWQPLGSPFRKLRVNPTEEREKLVHEVKTSMPAPFNGRFNPTNTLHESHDGSTYSLNSNNNYMYRSIQ